MKKIYTAPATVLVKTDIQAILAGSGDSLTADKDKTFNGTEALSKKHSFTSENLWEQDWDDEEED